MNTHFRFAITFAGPARALAPLVTVALSITGIAAIMSAPELSRACVFGNQTWGVWATTSARVLAILVGVITQFMKAALRYDKRRFNHRRC